MKNDLLSSRHPAQRVPLRFTPGMLLASLALLVVLYVVGLWVYHRYIVSDEEKIRGLVLSAARAAQERNPGGITATLSENFVCTCEAGVFDRDTCRQAFIQLLMYTYRHVEVRLAPDPIPIELGPDRKVAEVAFSAQVLGRIADDAPLEDIQQRAGGTRYVLTAKLTENGWKFSNLRIEKEP